MRQETNPYLLRTFALHFRTDRTALTKPTSCVMKGDSWWGVWGRRVRHPAGRGQRETTNEVFSCIRSWERVAQKTHKNANMFRDIYIYLWFSVHARCGFCKSKSYGPVQYGDIKSEIWRCGSVRYLGNVKPTMRFGFVMYSTVRFGAAFKNRKPYIAVRTCFGKSEILPCGSVWWYTIRSRSVRLQVKTVFLRCGSNPRWEKCQKPFFYLGCTVFINRTKPRFVPFSGFF